MSTALGTPIATYQARRTRARELAERYPHAGEMLRLYASLLDVQERAGTAATEAGPGFDELPRWVAEAVAPAVVTVTAAVGPETLVTALQALVYAGGVQDAIGGWLTGAEQEPAARYLARASCAPVLEALPGVMPRPEAPDRLHCPECGAPPQVSVFTAGGEALLTGQRMLECSRCARAWPVARMVCAGCGESESRNLPVYADHDVFPSLRVDACASCRRYLVTVDCAKDGRAVPVVDELAAIPLDLYARDRGLAKITPNLMGF